MGFFLYEYISILADYFVIKSLRIQYKETMPKLVVHLHKFSEMYSLIRAQAFYEWQYQFEFRGRIYLQEQAYPDRHVEKKNWK